MVFTGILLLLLLLLLLSQDQLNGCCHIETAVAVNKRGQVTADPSLQL
jgi:hypothetical protein